MDDVLAVKVVHRLEQSSDEVTRLLLVVESLGHDAIKQLSTFKAADGRTRHRHFRHDATMPQ